MSFFEAVASAFQNAQQSESPHVACYNLAGETVRMEVVGTALAEQILPPFAHLKIADDLQDNLQSDSADFGLRVRLWDASTTGVPRPAGLPPETRSDEWSSPSQTFAYGCKRRYAEYASSIGITWLDRAERIFYGCYDDARRFSIYDSSRPLSWLLPIWCNDLGLQSVHAGMVSRGGKGILIAGKSGSGKTTTTLSCLNAGFHFLAEDQTMVGERGGEFQGFSLYDTARLEAEHLKRFPVLEGRAIQENDAKTLIRLADLFPDQFAASAPICAVMLPSIPNDASSADVTTLEPATSAQALRAIAANSLMLPVGGGRRGFERLSRLVKTVPCYHLKLGRDVNDIARAMLGVLPA